MRTKHLLWALALPAVFTACTNDDFESVVQDNNTLQGRPMAGNVELNFGFGDADTRLTTDFQFEVDDEIGATLMDEYEGSGFNKGYNIWGLPNQKNVYTFVDYIQTNYRYTNTANGWENSNLLCSGNYFFYYPYMTTLNTRKAFEKYLNPNQVLTANTKEAGRQLIIDNQMYVGYKLVEGATEGSTQVLNVKMSPVFAYPYFEIMCTDAEPVTIEKIALQYIDKTKDMPLMAIVDPAKAVQDFKGDESFIYKQMENGEEVKYVDFEKDPTSAVRMGVPGKDKPQLDKDAVIATRQIQVTFPEGTTTKNGSPVRAYMVIPAGRYTHESNVNNAVELLIYTSKGLVTADLSVAHENTGVTGGQNNVTNDVAMGEVSGTMASPRVIKITFDEVAINNPDEFTTTSTEDLDSYVSWSAQIGGTKNMYVKSTNKDTELSAATVATLAKNQNITMNVLGDITIAEDVKSEDFAAAKINFLGAKVSATCITGNDGKVTGVEIKDDDKGQTIYNKATLTLAESWTDPEDGDITLVNDGMLTLRGASYTIDFVNNGNINVSSAQTNGTVSFTLSANNEDFVNNGFVDINSNMTLTNSFGIGNNGTINIHRGTTNGKIENLFTVIPGGCHYGCITVDEGATWALKGMNAYNKGKIDNNGTIEVGKDVTYINDVDQPYTNALGQADAWTPVVNNNGTLAGITNNGLVVQGKNAAYSTNGVEGAKGEVDNTAISGRTVASKDEVIFVKVTKAANAKALNKRLADAQAELVRFVDAGSLTIADADYAKDATSFTLTIPTVEIQGDLTISTPAGKELNIFTGVNGETTVDIKKGTVTIAEQSKVSLGSDRYGSTIKLAKGTLLNVNNNATLTSEVNIKFRGEGMVGNYGTIKNVKKGQEPKLTTGSKDYTTVE